MTPEPMSVEQLKARLRQLVPGVTAAPEARGGYAATFGGHHSIKVPRERLPVPEIVEMVLRTLGCHDLGRAEKLAWEYPFRFNGIPTSLALQKFGLHLYLGTKQVEDEARAQQLADQVIDQLAKGQRLIESVVLRPYGVRQMRAGCVTIVNQYGRLRGMYEYFRTGADLAYGRKGRLADRSKPEWTQVWPNRAEGFYNTVAMVSAYFSLLEHILVLALPFVGYSALTDDLLTIIGSRWSKKFQRIADINADKRAKFFYDRLHDIAEEYKNTYGHGGFDKGNATVAFHVEGIGAVPAALSDVRDKPVFQFIPGSEDDLARISGLFDEIDKWLDEGPAYLAMMWIKSGLDVRYDPDFLNELDAALRAEGDVFDRMLERHSMDWERQANMDW